MTDMNGKTELALLTQAVGTQTKTIEGLTKSLEDFKEKGGVKCAIHEEQLKNGVESFKALWDRVKWHEKIFVGSCIVGVAVKMVFFA